MLLGICFSAFVGSALVGCFKIDILFFCLCLNCWGSPKACCLYAVRWWHLGPGYTAHQTHAPAVLSAGRRLVGPALALLCAPCGLNGPFCTRSLAGAFGDARKGPHTPVSRGSHFCWHLCPAGTLQAHLLRPPRAPFPAPPVGSRAAGPQAATFSTLFAGGCEAWCPSPVWLGLASPATPPAS